MALNPLKDSPPPHPSTGKKQGSRWVAVWNLPLSVLLFCREAYDPNFRGQEASEDLKVHYQYEKLGCPLLAYYDTPWKPVVEL